jgi:hypothetical protein
MEVQQQQILDDTSSSSSSSAPPRASLKRKEWSSMEEQGLDEFNAHKGMRKRRVFETGEERRRRAAPLWRSLGDAHDHVFGLDHISYTKENQLLSPLTMLLREGIPAESQLIAACLQGDADDDGKEEEATDVEEDGGKASATTTSEDGEKMEKDQKETPGEEQQTCTTSVATAAAAAAATPSLSKQEQVLLRAIEAGSPMPMIRRGLRLQCLHWRRQHGEKEEVAEDEGEDVEEAMAAQTQLVTEVVERHLTRFSPHGPLLFSEDYIATINGRERREAERWARQGGSANSARTSSVATTGDAAERRHRHRQMRRRRQRRRRRRLNLGYDDAGSEDDYEFDSHDEDDEGYDDDDDDDNDTADEDDDEEEDEDGEENNNTPEVNSYETVIVSHDDAESLPPSQFTTTTTTTSATTTTTSSSPSSTFSSSSTLPSGKRRRLQTSPSRAEEGGRADERLFSMADDGGDTQDDAADLAPRPPLLNIDPAMEAGTDGALSTHAFVCRVCVCVFVRARCVLCAHALTGVRCC